jgi:hypothetical protein
MSQRERRWLGLAPALGIILALPGCRVVGGVFKAGVWAGVIAVVIAVAVIAGIAVFVRRLVAPRHT